MWCGSIRDPHISIKAISLTGVQHGEEGEESEEDGEEGSEEEEVQEEVRSRRRQLPTK
jgi:hypothetical protein